jgi:hypothetical protein
MIDRWKEVIVANWQVSFIVCLALIAIIEGAIWYHAYRFKKYADKWWAAEMEAVCIVWLLIAACYFGYSKTDNERYTYERKITSAWF